MFSLSEFKYKARYIYKNGDKDGAEKILKECAAKFDVSRSEANVSFLKSYGMIFVELFLISDSDECKENLLLEAMKYFDTFPHFAAVTLWRCSNSAGFEELTIKAMIRFVKWKKYNHGSSMLKSINSIDDEAAEIILILARIQWNLFIRKSFYKVIDLEALISDYPQHSYFKTRLTILQKCNSNFSQTEYQDNEW